MKTISGRLISSKPISLSKAASVLSTFISAETGASQAVSAYLRRASASFNDLVQLHRQLKSGRSERKHQKTRVKAVDNENVVDAGKNPREDGGRILDLGEEQSYGYHGNSDTGTKKKTKNSGFNDRRAEIEERESGGGVGIEEEKSKERKKRTKMEVDDSEERHNRKKKKRKHEGEKK